MLLMNGIKWKLDVNIDQLILKKEDQIQFYFVIYKRKL